MDRPRRQVLRMVSLRTVAGAAGCDVRLCLRLWSEPCTCSRRSGGAASAWLVTHRTCRHRPDFDTNPQRRHVEDGGYRRGPGALTLMEE